MLHSAAASSASRDRASRRLIGSGLEGSARIIAYRPRRSAGKQGSGFLLGFTSQRHGTPCA